MIVLKNGLARPACWKKTFNHKTPLSFRIRKAQELKLRLTLTRSVSEDYRDTNGLLPTQDRKRNQGSTQIGAPEEVQVRAFPSRLGCRGGYYSLEIKLHHPKLAVHVVPRDSAVKSPKSFSCSLDPAFS